MMRCTFDANEQAEHFALATQQNNMFLSLNEQQQFNFPRPSPNMCFIQLEPTILYLYKKESFYTDDQFCLSLYIIVIKLVYISVNTT